MGNAVLRAIGSSLAQRPRMQTAPSNGSDFREAVSSGGLQMTTNVRVMSSQEPFPTVELLVEDLERRRDASEALLSARILELELKLLRSHNSLLSTAIDART